MGESLHPNPDRLTTKHKVRFGIYETSEQVSGSDVVVFLNHTWSLFQRADAARRISCKQNVCLSIMGDSRRSGFTGRNVYI
jgi:hypothetical protein